MIPDYFTKGSTPKYFGTSAILNAAIFKKVIPRNIGSEEALMDTLWAGFRYFASEHYGEDEMAREIARQLSGKKASEVFSSCVEIIIEELNGAGVPEELLNPRRMSWKKLYDICATHKYGKNKNLFLGREFEAYALSEDEEEDIDKLRKLKSCAKAQAVFDDGGGRDETQIWKLWEAERGREYKRLGGINEALYHVEEISLNQQANVAADAQLL
ncbi:hypothetical protein QFC24_005094 [Naganishia onofrii]|uniref:Uncharacterized protein n=1 Tax=Naganishia onofrii TaxID=1851511 RepID=A0ACC2XEG5_9TREE|nr:hypothetical protein QFC24_005094 [Naganishia onofrii]